MTMTSRRGLVLGAPAALLADAVGEQRLQAQAGDGVDLDAELVAACQQERLARSRVDQEDAHPSGDDDLIRVIFEAWDEAVERVAGIVPRTPQGIRLKAEVAYRALISEFGCCNGRDWRDEANPSELLAIAVLFEVASAGGRVPQG
jgi:hypothetical protein